MKVLNLIQIPIDSDYISSSASREEKSILEKVKQNTFASSKNVSKLEDDDEDMEKQKDQIAPTIDYISKCNLN